MKNGFSAVQLRMGTRVELEHTKSKKVARRIAIDHLKEHPRYYTFLGRMERKLKKLEKRR